MAMIDLRQLQALRAVHDAGSITGAARSLRWSQPTVDYHLANLERLIGAPVLHRTTRGSTLTPAGLLLFDRGREILTLTDRALADARELTEMGRTRLKFGIFPTAAAKLLPAIVTRLNSLGIEVDAALAEASDLVVEMNGGAFDAALVYSVPGYELALRSNLVAAEVLRDPLMLALPESHPLATTAPIDMATLLTLHEERWVFGNADDPVDTLITDLFAAAGRTIEVAIRADDFQVVLGIIAARMGVCLIPRLASGAAHPGVVLRPVEDSAFVRSLQLVAPRDAARGHASPAVRQLAAAIGEAVSSLD